MKPQCASAPGCSNTARAIPPGWTVWKTRWPRPAWRLPPARAATVERLNRALAERGLAGAFPAASLALTGDIHDSFDSLRDALAASRIRDAEAGRTLTGPHLTDLAARHTQKRADARDCSTGEQKALLISIILADARELSRARDGLAPLLLLDEIAAHLDTIRRAALFEEIADLGAQAWMTGTDLSLFHAARAQIFAVEDGQFPRRRHSMIPLHNYLIYFALYAVAVASSRARHFRHYLPARWAAAFAPPFLPLSETHWET